MATLFNKQTQTKIILRVNHTFGRDAKTNITTLQNLGVSRNHAAITWDNESWKIKDTSSNGTYVNNSRISAGKYHELPAKATLQFGRAPAETWELLDLTPPITGLIPLTEGQVLIPLHDAHLLPIEECNIMIYLSEDGQWLCEVNSETSVLNSGDKVGSHGKFWQFVDARPCASTIAMNMSVPHNDIKFCFTASQNEEHVTLNLVVDNTPIDLGERNHHYLLLLLAKQRIEDVEKGYAEPEQGWVKKDVLVHMMGIAEQHINIQIYRFRKQVAKDLPQSSTLYQVIERRPGELRFAYTDITIKGGFDKQNSTS